MAELDIQAIVADCTRFLQGHGPKSVRERMQEIADNPLSQIRNDNYGNGGYLNELEREVAGLLGKEAAVFMPSGTMAQPIALRIWSDLSGIPTVAFHPTCHLHIHEQMGYAELHSLEAVLLGEEDRLFTLEDLQAIGRPISTLLIELPQREIGGQLPRWDKLVAICEEARSRGMKLHMDGARLWECQPYYQRSYAEICALFDSVYVSFYKILGGLPGAILAGPTDLIDKAKVWQRRQGGNLQQQSPAAIAGKIGLDRHLPKMAAYVYKAQEIAEILKEFEGVQVVPEHPQTNMMHVQFGIDSEKLMAASWQLAAESKTLLISYLRPGGVLELTVGEATLLLSAREIGLLFHRLLEIANQSS